MGTRGILEKLLPHTQIHTIIPKRKRKKKKIKNRVFCGLIENGGLDFC